MFALANIKDVAKKAGVGIATVSRVINHSGYVKKETREKIERVIRECGYVPNEIARSMTAQKNLIVAFMIPNTTHRFFGELLYHVEMELDHRGYKTMVCSSSEQIEKEISYIDMLKKNRVDSLILLTNNDIEPYLDRRFPLVSFDRRFKGIPCVTSDNYQGGVLAARHLIESGCRHMMFVGDDAQGGKAEVITEVNKRREGFFDELKRQGYPDVVNIEYPLGNYIALPESVHRRIESYAEVDGIFAISDSVAAEVIKNIERRGRLVPEDVKVVGYDGGTSFLNLGKRITSIDQPPKEIASAIGEVIQGYYDNRKTGDRIVPVKLVKGDTT